MKYLIGVFFVLNVSSATAFTNEEVEVEASNAKIKGTLTWSGDASNPQTLVILIAGSGPTDRDGNNAQMTNNSLKMLGEELTNNGFACLRYDKRGTAASKLPDDFNPKKMSFEFFIEDANSWVNLFAADERFDKIVLAGHSQGSLIALCVANKNENVDAVISLAGAGRPIQEVLKKQLAATLSIEMQGLVNAKLDTLAKGDTLKDAPQMLHSIMHPSIQPFLSSWMKYDPCKQIATLSVPVLLVNGTTDIQVGVEEMELLAKAYPAAKAIKIKKMNHIFKTIKSTDMGLQLELYAEPDAPIHKKLTSTLVKFLNELD